MLTAPLSYTVLVGLLTFPQSWVPHLQYGEGNSACHAWHTGEGFVGPIRVGHCDSCHPRLLWVRYFFFKVTEPCLISLPCDTLHTVHSKLHSVYSIAQRRAAPLGVGMKSHPLGLCLGSMAVSLPLADQNSQGFTEGTWKTTPYPTIEESKAQRNNGLWIYFNFYKFKWNFLKIWLELIWEIHASK